MNNISEQCDVVLHFDKNVDLQVKLACKEFRKWLKLNKYLSSIVQVYVKSSEKVKTKDKKSAVGIFGTPLYKYPYIKISAGDFQSLKYKRGNYNALMCILDAFAHEIVHYNQWIKNKPYKESEANRTGKIMVEKYSEFKNGILIANKKELELIDKGDRCCDDENYAGAIKYYNKVINLNPYLDCIFRNMGDLYGLLNKHKEAIDYYNKAIELNQQNYEAYLNKGYSLDELKRFDDAILCYDYVISHNPEEIYAYLNKGYALLYSNRYEEALDYFNKVIDIDSENEDAFIFKAQTLKALSKFEEALSCYDMALKINSENEITYNGEGCIFYILKKYEKSIILYNKSITIDPEYAEAYYNRAISYMALNDIENCLDSLKMAIKIDNRYKDYAIEEKYFDNINNLESTLKQ